MADVREVTPAELQQMRDDGATLLDVREPWETEVCQLEGSLLIPMRSLPQRLQEVPTDRPVAVICHSGIRSYMVAQWLGQQGYDAVSVAGGIDRWAAEADPQMRRY
jgi:rhodanese-related sulfurtransferase